MMEFPVSHTSGFTHTFVMFAEQLTPQAATTEWGEGTDMALVVSEGLISA